MEPQQYHSKQGQQGYYLSRGSLQGPEAKITEQKTGLSIVLNGIFHVIILALTILFVMVGARGPDINSVALINGITINLFFALIIWLPRKNIQRGRKTLYSCLLFFTTIFFLYIC